MKWLEKFREDCEEGCELPSSWIAFGRIVPYNWESCGGPHTNVQMERYILIRLPSFQWKVRSSFNRDGGSWEWHQLVFFWVWTEEKPVRHSHLPLPSKTRTIGFRWWCVT